MRDKRNKVFADSLKTISRKTGNRVFEDINHYLEVAQRRDLKFSSEHVEAIRDVDTAMYENFKLIRTPFNYNIGPSRKKDLFLFQCSSNPRDDNTDMLTTVDKQFIKK